MSFITTNFNVNMLSGFSGVAPTNCLSSIFHFGSRRGITTRKKWIRSSCWSAHLHSQLQSFRKFRWAVSEKWRWQTVLSSIFHFGQISKFKKGTPRKDSCRYAHLHIIFFITTKFHEILLSCFGGVALTRKTGLTDWLTDERVKNIIPSATCCL